MSILNMSISMFFIWLSIAACKQQTSSAELFKPSVLTPVNSSTSGVEGPAVDKSGTIYFVNFAHQGNLESFRVDIPGREWEMQRRVENQ